MVLAYVLGYVSRPLLDKFKVDPAKVALGFDKKPHWEDSASTLGLISAYGSYGEKSFLTESQAASIVKKIIENENVAISNRLMVEKAAFIYGLL